MNFPYAISIAQNYQTTLAMVNFIQYYVFLPNLVNSPYISPNLDDNLCKENIL